MIRARKQCSGFIIGLCLLSLSMILSAQSEPEYRDHILSDGVLTNEELAHVVRRAQDDLKLITEKAVNAAGSVMERELVFGPQAWMLMKNGDIKPLRLGEEGKGAPADMKVLMYRAGLRSLARHGQIDAAVVIYPGTIDKQGEKQRIAAVEHEHRLGVSGLKLIPVDLEGGKAVFRSVISQDKSFQIFYDDRKSK
ncbi:hypothetical protein [Marinobacter nauticus]|uniref:Uncharacterized protein n=1 Tax=Marinobacter nauticus TaxID=2743 RepID=A0A1M2UYV6_MARNT|nr:hypothetical protein [Marinobacter nauticus]OJT00528.1 hypothetical protein BEE62_10825 [Marinobacter nauticus]